MNGPRVIQAWKDPEYRSMLSTQERSKLPDHPSGLVELADEDLNAATGGCSLAGTCSVFTLGCCEKPR